MQGRPRSAGSAPDDRWPSLEFGGAYETLVDEDDELVLDGIDTKTGARVVVSMRDLGEGVSAGFWDEEIARLMHVRHPSAGHVLGARIEQDRFFVVTIKAPAEAVSLKQRLELGPLTGPEATQLTLATLDVAVELHALGLSAAGTRLRSTMVLHGADGSHAYLVTTFGLHVDNDVEVFNDLRDIALRILGLVGGRQERGALIIPADVFPAEIERLFRRAVGVERPTLRSAREMLDALVGLTDHPAQRRRRGDRMQVSTRPRAQATTMYGSELLLAEEFLAGNASDETPPPLPGASQPD